MNYKELVKIAKEKLREASILTTDADYTLILKDTIGQLQEEFEVNK